MYLMHKDIVVAKIEVNQNRPYRVNEIYQPEEMPVGTIGDIGFASRNIMRWHSKRAIPIGRINSDKIEDKLGSVDELSIKSYGLSLTDSYWYKDENSDLQWKDVNFYENGFVPDLLLLKKGLLDHQHIGPDYTTNGCLDKFWIYQNGVPYLIKAGGLNPHDRILAANEVVAYRIANRLQLDAVPYEKAEIDNEIFCACPSFIKNDKEEFVTLTQLEMQLDTHDDNYIIRDYLEKKGFQTYLDNLASFDILIHNHDRHLDNGGLIRNTQTKEYIKPCPIFDSGSCLNWHNIDVGTDNMRPFESCIKEYASHIKNPIVIDNTNDLIDIIQSVYREFNISDKQTQIATKELLNGCDILHSVQEVEIEEMDGFDPTED